jgi:hypothetical protein
MTEEIIDRLRRAEEVLRMLPGLILSQSQAESIGLLDVSEFRGIPFSDLADAVADAYWPHLPTSERGERA